MGPTSRTLARLALAAASVLLALAGLELWCRATRSRPPRLPSAVSLCRPLDDASGLRYELTPDQVVTHLLPLPGGEREVVYTVDAAGHRGAPVPPRAEDPDGRLRIAVVGDSFTFGSLVSDDETLPAQLERELEAAGHAARVINLGVPGYQLRQLVATLELRVPHYEPDLVLLCLYVNDTIKTAPTYDGRAVITDPAPLTDAERWARRLGLTRPGVAPLPDDPAQQRMSVLRRRSALVDRLASTLYLVLEERVRRAEHVHRWREDGAGWGRLLAALDRARELARRDGYELWVTSYPSLPWIDRDPYPLADAHARLAAACVERGIRYHDLLPAFSGRDPAALWAHPLDQHPSAAGHQVAARHLARELASILDAAR